MNKYEVAVLADEYHSKRQIWQAMGIANTPTDPEESRRAMIAYHIAEAEMIEALRRLEQAKFSVE
jgi:hypothetical protein